MSQRQAKRARREAAAAARAPRPGGVDRRILLAAGGALLVALVIGIGIVAAQNNGAATLTPVSAPAGAPSVQKVAGTDPVTGKPVALAAFKGKPTVVTIWASWCHGCNAEADTVARVVAAHPEVNFVGINFQDTPSGAKQFYDRYGWKFPSIGDPQGDLSFSFGLQGRRPRSS